MIRHNVGHQYAQANTHTTIKHEPYYNQPSIDNTEILASLSKSHKTKTNRTKNKIKIISNTDPKKPGVNHAGVREW